MEHNDPQGMDSDDVRPVQVMEQDEPQRLCAGDTKNVGQTKFSKAIADDRTFRI